MKVIFCSEPFFPLQVDSAYEDEANAANKVELEFALLDFEALVNEENITKAVRKISVQKEPTTAIYRGWMLKPDIYGKLFEVLISRNINLINSPEEYVHCHYLPASYPIIENKTPKTISIEIASEIDFDGIMERISVFGDKPIILKDFVKSRKHEWNDACFISSALNLQEVIRVIKNFLELQGEDLNKGLVFREFIEFQPLVAHSKSQMPLTKEFRLFFLDGKMLDYFKYWDEGDYGETKLPEEQFSEIATRVKSRFFTMDIAQTIQSEWLIVELGDGQVAGLPDNADLENFYNKLKSVNL